MANKTPRSRHQSPSFWSSCFSESYMFLYYKYSCGFRINYSSDVGMASTLRTGAGSVFWYCRAPFSSCGAEFLEQWNLWAVYSRCRACQALTGYLHFMVKVVALGESREECYGFEETLRDVVGLSGPVLFFRHEPCMGSTVRPFLTRKVYLCLTFFSPVVPLFKLCWEAKRRKRTHFKVSAEKFQVPLANSTTSVMMSIGLKCSTRLFFLLFAL